MWGIYFSRSDRWLSDLNNKYSWDSWEKTNLKYKTKKLAEFAYKKLYSQGNSNVELKQGDSPALKFKTYKSSKRKIQIIK